MNNNNSRRHHYVPKTYLREFTNLHSKLYSIKKTLLGKDIIKEFTPSQVCYKQDFHRINDLNLFPNIEDRLILENQGFIWYENHFGGIVRKIKDRNHLSYQESNRLLAALLNIKFRNPRIRGHFKEMTTNQSFFEKHRQILVKEKELNLNPILDHFSLDQIESTINSIQLQWLGNEELEKDIHIRYLFETSFSQDSSNTWTELRQYLINCQWHILEPHNNNTVFITSDNPGFCIDHNNDLFNTKFANCSFQFFFPLTPKSILVVTNIGQIPSTTNYKTINYLPVSSQFVKSINTATFHICNERVFSSNEYILSSLMKEY